MPFFVTNSNRVMCHVAVVLASIFFQPAPAQSLPLGTIRDVKALGAEAKGHAPVKLTGVVTALSGWKNSFFLQDATEAISVDRLDRAPIPHPGDLVEVSGTSEAGLFAPIVVSSQVRIVGRASLPAAATFDLRQLVTGGQDAHRIAVRGIVRSAEVKTIWGRPVLYLRLDMGTGEAAVHVLRVPSSFKQLVDAEVLIKGVCGTNFNGAGQIVGIRLFVPEIGDIAVEKPSVADPFSLPARTIQSLMRFGQTSVLSHQVRVRGIVTYQDPGKELYIQDGNRGLAIRSSQRTPVQLGTEVDAVGFLSMGAFAPALIDAVFRATPRRVPVQPVSVNANRLLIERDGFKSAPYNGQLVSTSGELVDRLSVGDTETFLLRTGNAMFSSRLPKRAGPIPDFANLPPGSLVAVTGICIVETDRAGDPIAIQLLPRSDADFRVLSKPTWWNAAHTQWVLIATAFLSTLVVFGNVILRRRIRRQVALLAETRTNYRRIIETANDAFIEMGPAGHILEWNGSAERIFGWKRAEVLGRELAETIVPETFRSAHRGGLRRFAETRQSKVLNQPVEMTAVTCDGKPVAVELTIWAVETFDGVRLNAFVRDISRRKDAENRLKESEETKRQILESSPDCIKVLDLQGHLLTMNAGGCRAMEIDCLDQLLSRYWPDLWPAEGRALAEQAVLAARRGEEAFFCGFCPTAKGAPKWWDVRITAIRNSTGQPGRLLAISRDITAQKAAELAASEAQRRLDLALTSAHIGPWTLDLTTDRLTWHENCSTLFGLERASRTTNLDAFVDLLHPEDKSHVQEKIAQALRTGHYEAEYRVIWPDGTLHVIAACGELSSSDLAPAQFVGICWDITQRKRAETALQESESKLREAQQIAHVGHWEFGLATQRIKWSDELFRIFGIPPEESITYERYLALLPEQDRERVIAAVERVISSGEPYELTHSLLLPDGSTRYVEGRGRLELDGSGRPATLVGTALDVTARVSSAMALQQSHDDLEKRVAERTAALKTEVKQREVSESHLRETERRLAIALEFSGVATWTWTPKEDSIVFSGPVERVFGRPARDLASFAAFQEVIHPDDRKELVRRVEACVNTGEDYEAEFRILIPGGEERWIAGRGRSLRHDGVVSQMSGVNFDITAKKRAEQRLLQSERHFRQLADAMPQIVWTAQPDGGLDYYNERWYNFTGFDRSLTGDQSWKPLLHPNDVQKGLDVWYASVRSGSPYEIEYRFWDRSSNRFRWHLGRALPIRNEGGEIVRWFGTCTDIDDYKRATTELQRLNEALEHRIEERSTKLAETEHRYRLLVEGVQDYAIFMLDAEGRITSWNHGAQRISQYGAEEITGKHFSIFYPDEVAASGHAARELRFAATEGQYREEGWRVRRDGSRFWAGVLITAIKDPGGKLRGYSKIVRDMTEQKEAEQSLISAQQRADVANRAKTDFLAAMSHEIRTPMNAILGMADLLWETELDQTQQHYVRVFRRAGGNLLTLVNDLLDLSKIESGQFELERLEFNLEELVERTVEIIGPKVRAKRLDLLVRIAPGTPIRLIGDPTRLQQILINLLGNAAKFTERGHIALNVEKDETAPQQLHFTVSDTGIGIPSDKIDLIFQDFVQAESSTTRRFGGTGLGLGICRRLVERMHGTLTVTSELGIGSAFTFNAIFASSERGTSEESRPDTSLVGQKVLVVDDNPTNRLIFTEICDASGMSVIECGSASAALTRIGEAMVREQPFDFALVDRALPDGDGLDLAERIRERYPSLRIVIVSSDDVPGDATRAKQLGLWGYATKPVRRSDLLRLLCRAAEEGHEDAQAGGSNSSHVAAETPGGMERILVADDAEDNRFLIQAYLKDCHYQLTFVENGEEAVRALTSQAFDLVFMDLQMPIMDGLTATSKIRQYEKATGHAPCPIVALTANARPEDVERCEKAGCTSHLSKPIAKPRLLDAIQRHLRKDSPVDPVPAIDVPRGFEHTAKRYIQSRQMEVEGMSQLVSDRDFERLRVLAHNMKGTGTSYGFAGLTQLGAALEVAARQGDAPAIREQITRLARYVGEAIGILG